MGVAENFAADFHSLFVTFVVVHYAAPQAERKSVTAAVNVDAASMLERCAAGSDTKRAPGILLARNWPSVAVVD